MNEYYGDYYEHFEEYSEKVENRIKELKRQKEHIRRDLFALNVLRRNWREKNEPILEK